MRNSLLEVLKIAFEATATVSLLFFSDFCVSLITQSLICLREYNAETMSVYNTNYGLSYQLVSNYFLKLLLAKLRAHKLYKSTWLAGKLCTLQTIRLLLQC